MKNIILAAIAAMTLTLTACDKTTIVQYNELPAAAQQTLSTYFADEQIAVIPKEYDDWGIRYNVIFSNANEIEFNKKGEWQDIKCRATKVPDGIVPERIMQYVVQTYPEAAIWELKRDKRSYEVELSNMVELKFDLNFNIIDLDHED